MNNTRLLSALKRACLMLVLVASGQSFSVLAAPDPALVVGPKECGECHKSEVEVWQESHHYKTFKSMPRSDEARDIADKMGIKRIKNESDCLACHFTSVMEAGDVKPIAGISCESCHAPAKEWLDVHNDFGGKDVKPADEDAAHRAARLAKMDKLGMIRPATLYALASNCLGCHTVPNEKLVNVGGHSAGSDFELVAWSQGEVRHNFVRSESGKENAKSSPEHLRVLYVLGRAADLEYSLRGVAKATQKAKFAVSMAKRVKRVSATLNEIQARVTIPEVADMLAAAGAASLKLNNEAELTAAADKVGAAARKFAMNHDGSGLAALDGLLPADADYKM